MEIFYRATKQLMALGEHTVARSDIAHDLRRQKLEAFLESSRPCGSHSRLNSFFACDSPHRAASFLRFQHGHEQGTGEVLIYELQMASPSKQPMALVDAVCKALDKKDRAKADLLAREYWQPTQQWLFWEYTSTEISVLRGGPRLPDEVADSAAVVDFCADQKLVENIGCRLAPKVFLPGSQKS